MALTPQETNFLIQPEPTYANAYDIRNSLHKSQYYFLTGQVLVVGALHPDDKKKGVYQWFDQQMIYLVEDFRQESLQVDFKHYPGQLTVPKATTEKYKEDKKEVFMTGVFKKKYQYFYRSKENMN
jgi:hypothetical protein